MPVMGLVVQRQVDGPAEDQEEAEDEAVGEADAMLRHGAIGGAGHAAIGGALEGLVEDAGAGGDQADAEEGFDESEMEGRDARGEGAEIEARCGVDDDHQRYARLDEHDVVAEQRVAAGAGGRYGRCGCGGHVEFKDIAIGRSYAGY